MFNFQKEVILNNVEKDAKVVKRGENDKAILQVRDGGKYYAENMKDVIVYETMPHVGKQATITLDPAKLAKLGSKHIQILIELGLDNDYRGDYGSAVWYFRKPVLVDLETAKISADSLVKAFKTVVPANYQFLVAEENGDNVVLTAEDKYIKVRKIQIIGFECDQHCGGEEQEQPVVLAECGAKEGEIQSEDKQTVVGSVTANKLDVGTYEYLLQNLRLPTYENIRFHSVAHAEMPVPGVEYVQYSFVYRVKRGMNFGGMSVVGQSNYSETMHTFFVPKDDADTFKNLLIEVGVPKENFESVVVPGYEEDADKPGGESDDVEVLGADQVVASDLE